MTLNDQAETTSRKQAAAESAVGLLEDGMIVGLGSGSTATLAVGAIGKRVAQGLRIIGVPTSEKTAALARQLNIALSTLEDHPEIDLTIDGADEVESSTLNLIKGGGGNQFREKIIAIASARLVIVVDESKVVSRLGSHFPVPVEVVQFGWESTAERLRRTGGTPVLRKGPEDKPYITDGGNYILDCRYGPIASPFALQKELDSVVGVVEHGLFIGLASQAIVAGSDGIITMKPSA